MFHVTNGDSAVESLRTAGIEGPILPWADVLHEGPVPAGLNVAELRTVRAHFLAGAGWAPLPDVLQDFQARDAAIEHLRPDEEIVLWFEHDLYDQLQLLQVMERVSDREKVTLVCTDEYLGPASPDRLQNLFLMRVLLDIDHFQLAALAWSAFRGRDPREIEVLLEGDLSTLPFLRAALRRHLEQFPSVAAGLSRSEQQILLVLDSGPCSIGELYVRSHHEREEAIFLGDTVFVRYLKSLRDVADPLLRTDGDNWNAQASITETGRAVLMGNADHIELNGIDRWLGGVHLHGPKVAWRWDAERGKLAEYSS